MSNQMHPTLRKNRWLIMIAMAIGTICINAVPYSVRSYYVVFQEAAGLTNLQLGQLMTAYGLGSMLFYFPGGWFADKWSPRKMLASSFFLGGGLTLLMLFMPSFTPMAGLFATFAFACNFLAWGAHVKLIGALGSAEEQGKMYGAREAIAGFAGMALGYIVLWMGEAAGGAPDVTYRFYVIVYAAFCFISGIMMLVFCKEEHLTNLTSAAVDLSYIKRVVKMPKVWLMAFIVIACYTAYSASSYLSPYLVDVYDASIGDSTSYGLMRSYGFRIFACSLLGVLADKMGSASKLLGICTAIIAAVAVGFLVTPGVPSTYILAVVMMIVWGVVATGMRGIYYAQIQEGGIPSEVRGTAIGLIAFLAYSPDAYFYNIVGGWIDSVGVKGYTYMFYYMAAMCALSILAGVVLIRMNKRDKAKAEN